MNKQAAYWQKRFTLMESKRFTDSMELYNEIAMLMDENISNLSDSIELFILRFSKENRISITEARKLMNSKELEEFRWTVEQYIAYGEKNAVTGEFIQKLKNASKRVHMNRLEALKIQCQFTIEKMYGQTLDKVSEFIKTSYEQEMYHTAFEIQKGTEVGCHFAKINKNKLDMIVNKAWSDDGITFSKRLWKRSEAMTKKVERELTRIVVTGENANKAAAHLTEFSKQQGKTAKQNAKTLILTENAYFSSKARKKSFEEMGVEEFQVIATLDERTSDICRDMDLKHYPLSEYVIGSTAPPFHPRCRTVTVPYFADLGGYRIARDAEGKNIKIPSDMNYHEWEEKYLISA